MNNKFYIDQHGCAKNQTDGELLCGFLTDAGFELTQNAEEASFIIINSCGFIESAKKESIDAIYSIKSAYPESKLILAGCLSERYAELFNQSIPELDGIFGNGDLSKIVDFMKNVLAGKRETKVYPQEGICYGKRPYLFNYKASAFVKITEGCSNNCSFCAIPIIRGPVRSRCVNDIVDEINQLVQKGVYEINLIGQDLAAFEYVTSENKLLNDEQNSSKCSALAFLMKKISLIQGDFIVRPLYIHPDHFNSDILEVMKKDNRFVPYFDIPFQSGDDKIIQLMNRKGSFDKYVNLVEKIRSELPGAVIRTTFLTGFPGETDKAAENTKNFLKKIDADWSGCFPYSREEDTPAYSFKNRVPAKIAKKRAQALEEIQQEITETHLKKYVGKELNILVEEIIELGEQAEDSSEGLALGRAWFQAPEVDGCVVIRYEADDAFEAEKVVPGNVVTVKVLAVTGVDLDSRFVKLHKKALNSDIKYINL